MIKFFKISLLILLLYFILFVASMLNPVYFVGESPNFKEGVFFNSFEDSSPGKRANLFFKWQKERLTQDVKWKKEDIAKYTNYVTYERREKDAALSVVFVGHNTFLIQIEGMNILTDPIWSERASPFSFVGPKRVTKPGVEINDIPNIDYVLISHTHYDHLDISTLKSLKQSFNPTVIAGLGVCYYINNIKKVMINCIEKDWGEFVEIAPDFKIFFEKAKHYSKRTLFDANKNLWGGFVISGNDYKVFYSGDTAYGKHFKMIGEQYGPFDLSLLEVGTYEPRYIMARSHVNPQEAVMAHLDLQSKQSIGMHLKTFQLSDERYNQPIEDLEKAKDQLGVINFRVLDFGERIEL